MRHKSDFQLFFEFDCIEKAEEGEQSRRICGYASTEALDKQGEILVQKGLDFTDFLKSGWFNDNHDRTTAGVLGYPTKVEYHEGKGWYVEGYLLKGYRKSDEIWELANALQKSNRKLGFSVEGNQVKRDLKSSNRVVKCNVTNVAITHCPVNSECTMEVLMKSMCSNISSQTCLHCNKECIKALETGYEQSTDMEGGAALRKQSIDGECKCQKEGSKCKKCNKHSEKSMLNYQEAIDVITKRGYDKNQAKEILSKLDTLGYLQQKAE